MDFVYIPSRNNEDELCINSHKPWDCLCYYCQTNILTCGIKPVACDGIKYEYDYTEEKELTKVIRECLDKGWTGLGFKTVEFENKWKEYTGLPFAHFLNSNTSGLHLAVHLLKMQNGWK